MLPAWATLCGGELEQDEVHEDSGDPEADIAAETEALEAALAEKEALDAKLEEAAFEAALEAVNDLGWDEEGDDCGTDLEEEGEVDPAAFGSKLKDDPATGAVKVTGGVACVG